jgi:hypothetical protein
MLRDARRTQSRWDRCPSRPRPAGARAGVLELAPGGRAQAPGRRVPPGPGCGRRHGRHRPVRRAGRAEGLLRARAPAFPTLPVATDAPSCLSDCKLPHEGTAKVPHEWTADEAHGEGAALSKDPRCSAERAGCATGVRQRPQPREPPLAGSQHRAEQGAGLPSQRVLEVQGRLCCRANRA